MSTIADRLKNLYDSMVIANNVTNEFTQALPDCYDAVEAKGGTIPAQQTAANLPTAIESIPAATPIHEEKDINFIDHTGTIVESYTFAEAANLSALPTAIEYDGLTFIEWQFTLQEVLFYVGKKCPLNVGAYYKTNDGKSHVKVSIPYDNFEYSIYMWGEAWNSNELIDWGDGSTSEINRGTATHAYSAKGEYEITIKAIGVGTYAISGDSNGKSGLCNRSITLAEDCTGVSVQYSRELRYIANNGGNSQRVVPYTGMPAALIFVGNFSISSAIYNKYICTRPYVVGGQFWRTGLVNATIIPPLAETNTDTGDAPFYDLYALKVIYFPASMTAFQSRVFRNNYSMRDVYIYSSSLPTLAGAGAFTSMNPYSPVTVHVLASLYSSYEADTNWAAVMANANFNFVGDL